MMPGEVSGLCAVQEEVGAVRTAWAARRDPGVDKEPTEAAAQGVKRQVMQAEAGPGPAVQGQ